MGQSSLSHHHKPLLGEKKKRIPSRIVMGEFGSGSLVDIFGYSFGCLILDSTGNYRPARSTTEADDNQTLLLQIESLQAQLEEQTKLAKEQVDALLEDRRVHMEEQQAQRERDADKIKTMQEKLRKTQDLLYDSTKDFLELKYEIRAKERHWMVDRDRLAQEIDHLREQLDVSGVSVLEVSGEVMEPRQAQLVAVQSLRHQLEQTQKLAEMYREQCIGLEDELARIREKTDVSEDIFKERSEKMSKRLALMNSRYENLEKRRAMEVEGFKTDIKMLRDKLKNVEKQLYKVRKNVLPYIVKYDWTLLEILLFKMPKCVKNKNRHVRSSQVYL